MSYLRHEYRFTLNYSEYLLLYSRLKSILNFDINSGTNGEYNVRTLYFDNCYDEALKDKLCGLNNREKFRIRFYNQDDSFIRLEKKLEKDGLFNKTFCTINKAECERILNNDVSWMLKDERFLLRDFYIKTKLNLLRPKVIVDFVRIPFVYENPNVRITLDRDIKTSLYNTDVFNFNIPLVDIGDKLYLLEVKYDEYLPDIIKNVVNLNTEMQVSYSKYSYSRKFG